MSLDLSKLKDVVLPALLAAIDKLKVDVPAAITAAANGADEATNQVAIDGITATLGTATDALTGLDASVALKA